MKKEESYQLVFPYSFYFNKKNRETEGFYSSVNKKNADPVVVD